jgi:hypothetical protein
MPVLVAVCAVIQMQQFNYFIQTKSEPLRKFHTSHPCDTCLVIAVNAAICLVWFWQQTLALIGANGFYIDLCCFGKTAGCLVC